MPLRDLETLRTERPDLAAVPLAEFAFPGPLRDLLVAAILSGNKTATTGLVIDYESLNEAFPKVGDLEIVVDSDGLAVAVIELTVVDFRTVGEVDLEIAIGEGEDYASVAEWRAGHDDFWTSAEFREAIGQPAFEAADDERAVVVWFRVIERL